MDVAKCARAVGLILVPILLVSCGGGDGPKPQNVRKTVPVHGEVYLDGKPGHGVKVTLNPADSTAVLGAFGQVGEDGTYKIHTYGTDDGAPIGEYILTFTYLDPKFPLRISDEDEPDDLKHKYSNPKTSKYKLSVTEVDTDIEVPRVDLTSK